MKKSILLLSAALFALTSCNRIRETDHEKTSDPAVVALSKEQFDATGIETGKPEKRIMSETIRANGMLDVPPQYLVSVSAPMGGFVKRTRLLQGMYVKRGESLIELESIDYIQLQQDYIDQQSQLDFATIEYNRQLELSNENISAQKTLQQAKSTFESQRARVEGLKAKLAMINIDPEKIRSGIIQRTIQLFSPIHGYITEVNVNIGQYVNATDVLIKIVDTNHLHVELFVFEQDVPKLKIDQKVFFNLVTESNVRTAHVHLINREIGEDRTVRVHCHLDEEDAALLPGMYVQASIETNTHEVLALPEDAIVNFDGTSYIFVTRDNEHFRTLAVKTGLIQDGAVEVIMPEEWDDRNSVVIRGAYELLGKMQNFGDED